MNNIDMLRYGMEMKEKKGGEKEWKRNIWKG